MKPGCRECFRIQNKLYKSLCVYSAALLHDNLLHITHFSRKSVTWWLPSFCPWYVNDPIITKCNMNSLIICAIQRNFLPSSHQGEGKTPKKVVFSYISSHKKNYAQACAQLHKISVLLMQPWLYDYCLQMFSFPFNKADMKRRRVVPN